MSTESEPQAQANLVEEARRHLGLLFNEIAQLSEQDLAPPDYYAEFLKRVLMALGAPAGAVWVRTPQGHLQLQYQINLRQVNLDQEGKGRESHDELLRQAFTQGRPVYVPPQSSMGTPAGPGPAAGNPSDYLVLLAPIRLDQQVVGLVEVWQRPNHPATAVPGFLQVLTRLAELASVFVRNHQRRRIIGEQQLWIQLEAFARQIHGSLNPTEVAYLVANEGRRLVECDRLSVALRQGRRTKVEAISGADVVEKRSNLVQLLRKLCDQVLAWGERLVYQGSRDESLPPNVVKALDDYLAESASKVLAVLPLRDEREGEGEKAKPARSALVLEAFEPAVTPEQLVTRLEVVGKHAASALYNASEYRRIPMRWVWRPLAQLQDGLGGPTRAIFAAVGVALGALAAALVFVPYPLKMDAKGQLLPQERHYIYSPVDGTVIRFEEGVEPSRDVTENQSLVLMHDLQLESKLVQLAGEIASAQQDVDAMGQQINAATNEQDRLRFTNERKQKEVVLNSKTQERNALRERTHSDEARPGYFWLKSPQRGTVLSWDFRETLTNRFVKPSEPLLRIGAKDRGWEVELKIPQKHIGQILQAFEPGNPRAELDVDLLVVSAPTRTFKGKLSRDKIAGEASPNKEDASDSEPMILASVRIDGSDIPAAQRIPPDLLVTGTEVHSKVRCGDRRLGYSLFYGLWEFVYEKVVFFVF